MSAGPRPCSNEPARVHPAPALPVTPATPGTTRPRHEADYVIVGAGSAGCTVAARLADAGHEVIVVEHGGTDRGPFIQMPAALSYPMNMRRYDWGYRTEPEPHMMGRRMAVPRGRVLGGSSSINGMVWVRGHARDFDAWAAMGASGWSYADLLPYFRRAETAHGSDDPVRGHDGPVHVTRGARTNPLYDAFIAAGREAGYEGTEDYNGARQEGFGPMEMNVWRGRRWSAANAYLRPALRRPGNRLRLIRGLAARVLFDSRRATGVEILRGRRRVAVRARREVILAASSINTPKLLMLSGIGPADALRYHGIDVLADRPGVGANLQDHLELYVQHECREPVSLYSSLNLWGKARIGAQWMLTGRGLGASNHFEAAAFVRTRAGVEWPDVQFHFLPVAIRYDGTAPVRAHGFQAHVGPMRARSRGAVTLRSADPAEPPAIRFDYLDNEADRADFRRTIEIAREVLGQGAMERYRGREIAPGPHVRSDAELDAHIAEHAESAYHPCGTARLGRADDEGAVVDPQCRVIGVEALRVVDTSLFPTITNGNLNAPAIAVAEKAADHIMGHEVLAAENLEPWVNPRWRESDR